MKSLETLMNNNKKRGKILKVEENLFCEGCKIVMTITKLKNLTEQYKKSEVVVIVKQSKWPNKSKRI